MTKAVFGLANDEAQARRIVDHLLSSGFSNEDISILYADRNKDKTRTNGRGDSEYGDSSIKRNVGESGLGDNEYGDLSIKRKAGETVTEKHSKAPEGGVAGATTGGILGGSIGLLAGIGALAIPGLGPFIAAGPIMAALSGSAVGGGLGLLIGTLIGSGIPEYEAKRYESGLKQGNILISVHSDTDEEIKRASEVMKQEGATDISVSSEKTRSSY